MSYGCKKYKLSKDARIETLVKQIAKDHGVPDYMDDKILFVNVGIGDTQDETFVAWEGERMRTWAMQDCPFSDNVSIPNRVSIMKSSWKMQYACVTVSEILEVKEEADEVVTEWEQRGMTRAAWAFATNVQMSRDVAEVAEQFETVLQDLEDAKKDVIAKEEGLFAVGREFATRYLDTKMFCQSEKIGNGMLGDWKSDRLAGVLSHVPVEFHETKYMQERGEYYFAWGINWQTCQGKVREPAGSAPRLKNLSTSERRQL